MEACIAVEREVDKVLTKFGGISEHADRILEDITTHIGAIKKELDECKYGMDNNVVMVRKAGYKLKFI